MYEGPLNSRDIETYCFINCIYRQRIWETLSTHVHTASTRTLRAAHAHASDKCVIYVNFIYRIKRQCLISLFRLAMYIGGTLIKNYLLTYLWATFCEYECYWCSAAVIAILYIGNIFLYCNAFKRHPIVLCLGWWRHGTDIFKALMARC